MAPHTWSHLGNTVSDDKYRMYYRRQRIKEAYYRGEKIWGEEEPVDYFIAFAGKYGNKVVLSATTRSADDPEVELENADVYFAVSTDKSSQASRRSISDITRNRNGKIYIDAQTQQYVPEGELANYGNLDCVVSVETTIGADFQAVFSVANPLREICVGMKGERKINVLPPIVDFRRGIRDMRGDSIFILRRVAELLQRACLRVG